MIEISLNNEVVQLEAATTLQQALQRWHYAEKKCAVAINGEFIPRQHYETTQLQQGDEVDVVAPVGGG